MARVLTTLHLSDIQKEVLAKVKAAPTPHLAWDEISGSATDVDENLATARDVLGNLGLLSVGDGVLEVTPKGEEVMKDENLIDDMGELTDTGRELADIERDPGEQEPTARAAQQPPQDQVGGGDEFEGIPMESFKLIKSVYEDAKVKEQLKLLEAKIPVTSEVASRIIEDVRLFLDGDLEWHDMSKTAQTFLYDQFMHEMPYGTMTGDTGTPDEWFMDQNPIEILDHVKARLYSMAKKGEEIWKY